MASIYTTLKLINSLSGSEKRHFKLCTIKQCGEKDYMGLFEILDSGSLSSLADISKVFQQRYPGSSLDSASRYLTKLITDSLIQTRIEKDSLFDCLQRLMRVKILQERSLTDEAYHELKKIRKTAESSQNHLVQYLTFRYELNHLSEVNFPGMSDTRLVEMQMKAKESLRTLHHIEGHYSLYELLKYRLIHLGGIASDEDKRQLNDLLLSEISLVTGKVKNSFESRKLHLLFQSFFFTHTGDHKSALRTFHELNKLFENNADLQEHPPIDYFSSLDGILDSLRSTHNYLQMPFYIEKLKNIDTESCPDHFRYLVQKTIVVYSLQVLISARDYKAATEFIKTLDPNLFTAYHLVNIEKRWELHFYCALIYFINKEYKKSLKYIKDITSDHTRYALLPIYKAIRMLNIIIHYELGDAVFLSYEIRSYKRFFNQKSKLLKSEKLVFKTIQFDPHNNTTAKNKMLAKKIESNCKLVYADKYESTLLKYIDLPGWALKKFLVRSLLTVPM